MCSIGACITEGSIKYYLYISQFLIFFDNFQSILMEMVVDEDFNENWD